MGSDNFFSKIASMDPLAQALNLPGAHKYAQAVAQRNAGATDVNGGAYTGITPTLAAANAGYQPGGPGASPGWQQINLGSNPSGLQDILTRGANVLGNAAIAKPGPGGSPISTPSFGTGNPYVQQSTTQNPYVQAARGATQQQNQWG
jgi:hypothetical protein